MYKNHIIKSVLIAILTAHSPLIFANNEIVTVPPDSSWERSDSSWEGYDPRNLTEEKVEFIYRALGQTKIVLDNLHPRHPNLKRQVLSQIKGFPIEALVFYAAIGATMVRASYTNSFSDGKADPRWLDNFTRELTTPIGLMSFFCFVLASGTTHHLYSKLTALFAPKIKLILQEQARKHLLNQDFSNKGKKKYGRSLRFFGAMGQLGGQFGMAFGLMASNIVHELDYTLSHSDNYKKCWKNVMKKAEDQDLACDAFWNESVSTAAGWAPGLASLLTASIISHAIVRQTAQAVTKGGKKISPFLKGAVSKMPLHQLGTVLRNAIHLIPIPHSTVVKGGQLMFRFLNLYAFMEVDQLITHRFWSWAWTEGQKAEYVAEAMADLNKHHSVDYTTPALKNCDEDENCEYDISIKSVHKFANRSKQWRQYQMMMADMALQNWFLYVSNALGSFDLSKKIYRSFFNKEMQNSSHFKHTRYFGGIEEDEAFEAFNKMKSIIDQNTDTTTETPNLKVVSLSPSRFLKPNIKNKNQMAVLSALFGTVSAEAPLESFYDDWSKAKELAKEEVLKSNVNPKLIITNYLTSLEKQIRHVIRHVKEQLKNENEQRDVLLEILNPAYKFTNSTIKNYKEELNATNVTLPEGSFIRSIAENYSESNGISLLAYLKKWSDIINYYHIILNNSNPSSDDLNSFFDQFVENIKTSRKEFLNQPIRINQNRLDEQINYVLRKRVLSAGIEYLNRIIESKKRHIQRQGHRGHAFSECLNNNPESYPEKVLITLCHLESRQSDVESKPNDYNILAQLYRETFLKQGDQHVQIKSIPQGMFIVEDINAGYKSQKERYQTSYHPSMLNSIRTPHIMDFIIASAVCGPDLKAPKHTNLLDKVNRVVKGNSDLETEFSKDRGLLGKIFGQEDATRPLEMDEIVKQMPVFDQKTFSNDFKFYPPRITKIDKSTRNAICYGRYARRQHNIVENIYDSYFKVGDKEYSNLLHLVLDHLNLEGISSLEEFDAWWENNIEPYKKLYIKTANRAYEKVVEEWFIEPLFKTDVKKVSMDGLSKDPVWGGSSGRFKEGELHLPKGAFLNMQFELNYWADVIVYLAEKRFNYFQKAFAECKNNPQSCPIEGYEAFLSSYNRTDLEKNLEEFIQFFNIGENCAGEGRDLSKDLTDFASYLSSNLLPEATKSNFDKNKSNNNIAECKAWSLEFMQKAKGGKEKLTAVGEQIMNLNIENLFIEANPFSSGRDSSKLSQDQIHQIHHDSAFAFASNHTPGGRETLLPDQLINYAFLRMNQILEEGMHYANMIKSISDQPDVLNATASPNL